jgi:hypothetical protein
MASSHWRYEYLMALANGQLTRVKELALTHGVDVRLSAGNTDVHRVNTGTN